MANDSEKSGSTVSPSFCPQCGYPVEVDAPECSSCAIPFDRSPAAMFSDSEGATGETFAVPVVPEESPPQTTAGSRGPSVTMRLGAIEAMRVRESLQPADPESAPSIVCEIPAVAPAASASRRPVRHRPLLVVAVLGVFAVAGLSALALRSPPLGPQFDAEAWEADAPISLPAHESILGLSQDNKEVVLSLCFQLSRHANTECRLSYLREIGEFPARNARFAAMAVDRYEVSNADWSACEAAGDCAERVVDNCTLYSVARGRELRTAVPGSMLAPDLPAVCVTYSEAQEYCRWRGGRLPTADEWERVARSGDDRLQPWGPFALPGLLNWGERILRDFPIPGRVDGFELTAPVDSYRGGATDDGVFNLLGNVAEWVEPSSEVSEGMAAVRGGSYVTEFQDLRSTFHSALPASESRSTVGLRCVYPSE